MNAPTFPCDSALAAFEPGGNITGLAVLWSTFGSDTACLTRWARRMQQLDVPHLLEIHLSNETCRRAKNRKCSDAELSPTLSVAEYNRALAARSAKVIEPLRARIVEIAQVVSAFNTPTLELILSTGLEDNYSREAYAVVLETVRANWPHKVVRNPVGALRDTAKLGADYLEIHGVSPEFSANEPCIANLDGVDIVFPHRQSPTRERVSWNAVKNYVRSYQPRCRVTFFWSAPWQGLFSDRFPNPSERTFKVSEADIAAIRSVAR